jgi:hypothetical protein
MSEIVGTIGLVSVMFILVYGVYIITKPHKFQKNL